MKVKNPFDLKIEVQKGMPSDIRDAAIVLTDTLDLCWAAAQAVFEKQAKPEHAIALLPMFMGRADAKRQQAEADYKAHADAVAGQLAAKPSRRRKPKAD
jgi:hypothetical protein